MSYQVLARKWRPRNFSELVGQEHVLQALTNALDNDRLHHAYLFTGTRGVGKTTIARIFAKSLNCETGVSAKPCGECSACLEIDEGRFVDLLEVDAASRTKVEDTRELLDNVQYAPTRGRYKVYLIDEVHMLSAHSFNALLKTLEEPPPHVKFLLATTDPQKLPATVLSRCLQFNLKRLQPPMIRDYLVELLEQEKIAFEIPALQLLARAADGSMRDALCLLDQAIAYGSGAVNEADVRAMLGTIEHTYIVKIIEALASANAAKLLQAVANAAERAPDFASILDELLSLLQYIAIAQSVPEAVDENIDAQEAVLELAQKMSPEDVQLFYQIGLIGRRDLFLSPDPRGGLEMVLLRMLTFRPVGSPQSARPATLPTKKTAKPTTENTSPASDVHSTEPQQTTVSSDGDWRTLVDSLSLKGMLRELAMNCDCQSKTGTRWVLLLDEAHQQLLNSERQDRLQEALCKSLGQPIKLDIQVASKAVETPAVQQRRETDERQAQAIAEIEADPNIKALQKTFGATVHEDSIRPLD
jgi:DNA polymerase-3 subunit gamma/tau